MNQPVQESAERLGATLRRLPTVVDDAAVKDLQRAVFAFVDEMRDTKGWPPEHILIALKRIAGEAGLQIRQRLAPIPDTLDGITTRAAVASRIIGWAIERYYGSTRPPA